MVSSGKQGKLFSKRSVGELNHRWFAARRHHFATKKIDETVQYLAHKESWAKAWNRMKKCVKYLGDWFDGL